MKYLLLTLLTTILITSCSKEDNPTLKKNTYTLELETYGIQSLYSILVVLEHEDGWDTTEHYSFYDAETTLSINIPSTATKLDVGIAISTPFSVRYKLYNKKTTIVDKTVTLTQTGFSYSYTF